MKLNKYILSLICATAASGVAFGQAAYSGYFLENYIHRYELNPAMASTDNNNFVAMPVLGNLNVGMHGNTGISSLFYNRNINGTDKTVLFTNENVSTEEALKKIHDKNRVGFGLNMDLLAVGFKALGGMNAVTIGAVADAEIMLPGSVFRMAKEGITNDTYDIKNLRFNANAYAKIQLNHSRDIKQLPGLRVGAAVKFLLGLANIDARLNEAQMVLGEDTWRITSNAEVMANIKGASFKQKYSEKHDNYYVDGLEMDGFGVNGFGLGFDLGATYKWRDFQFSLALLDLGFISWSNGIKATSDGTHEVSTSDYTFTIGKEDLPEGEKSEWDKFTDNLSKLYELKDDGKAGSRTTGLRATLNWGVQYTLPYYRNLTFGMVNTTKFNGSFTWTDFRFSANVRPVKCLSASANFAAGTYGVAFGWLVNLNVEGFNLFLGMDRTMGKLAKQGIPLNSNAEVNLGMNFPF